MMADDTTCRFFRRCSPSVRVALDEMCHRHKLSCSNGSNSVTGRSVGGEYSVC